MHGSRGNPRPYYNNHNHNYHAMAHNDPNRVSTADSGRESMSFSSRSTAASRITTVSVSSPFSADTPLNNYESTISDKKPNEKPIYIRRTDVLLGKTYEQAFVSHIDHPSAFFLQLTVHRTKYQDLHKKINEYYSKNPMSDPSKVWKRGEYCIAKFTDNQFYRARIIEIPEVTETPDQYGVVYVDYGNWGKVDSNNIHRLLSEFTELSAHAIPCSLSKTLPRGNTWFEHTKAIDLFEALVYNKYVDATFILRNDRDCWPLHFVDLKLSSDKTNIRECMEQANLVRIDSNDKFYIEFHSLFQDVDEFIYNIRREDSEMYETDDNE